jgi:hypothetical protein
MPVAEAYEASLRERGARVTLRQELDGGWTVRLKGLAEDANRLVHSSSSFRSVSEWFVRGSLRDAATRGPLASTPLALLRAALQRDADS